MMENNDLWTLSGFRGYAVQPLRVCPLRASIRGKELERSRFFGYRCAMTAGRKKKEQQRAWALGKCYRGWIARAQNGLCASCGLPLNMARQIHPTHADAPTVDHVFPRHAGGSRDLDNVIVMHRKCNNRKAGRAPNGCELLWLTAVTAKLTTEFGAATKR